jgi:hypothetical protein
MGAEAFASLAPKAINPRPSIDDTMNFFIWHPP